MQMQMQMQMQMHILSILCVLISAADGFVPRVTKSIIKGAEKYSGFSSVARFGNSDTLILTVGNRLHISFDDGAHWEIVSGIEGVHMKISIDEFHEGRAFVSDRSFNIPEIHITEDEGRSWMSFSLPEDPEPYYKNCSPHTHPSNKKLLLLDCSIGRIESFGGQTFFGENIIYGSDDGGRSFKPIMDSENYFTTSCQFAGSEVLSKKDGGIYCVQATEASGGGTFFYTSDFGKTKKTFDEFNGFSVERMFILPSSVGVVTSGARGIFSTPWETRKLWISKDGVFEAAHIPKDVIVLSIWNLSEDDQGRLLLDATVQDNETFESLTRLLVSDSSGLNFSLQEFGSRYDDDDDDYMERQVGKLRGTLRKSSTAVGTIQDMIKASENTTLGGTRNPKDVWWKEIGKNTNRLLEILSLLYWFLKRLSNFVYKLLPGDSMLHSVSTVNKFSFDTMLHSVSAVNKFSFDNGKSWASLRIEDPSGSHRHLFKCDIDDVERCSLQFGYPHIEDGPTAGIIMSNGVAGENPLALWDDHMAFISRDGGISWEVAFENPVRAVSLDFGNILVVSPIEASRQYFGGYVELYSKLYFSLDQGITWTVYHFDEPIYAYNNIEFSARGLKAYLKFPKEVEDSDEYVYYIVDFSNAFDGTACTANDWETWYSSSGTCIDGIRYSFERRKPDANCLMTKTFEKVELHEEKCI